MSSRILARLVKLAPLLLQFPTDAAKLFGFKPGAGWQEVVIPAFSKAATIDATAATAATVILADADKYKRFTAAGAVSYTVPANATLAFPIEGEIQLRRAAAANNLTIVAASGVTINAPAGGTLVLGPRMTACLKKVGTNEWDLIGQTVAA